ncbi:DUF4258 domain-containing protein [Nesterenkonia sp. HG001]|uniref:DUF4258 domain-containing protein n=1 Tax=Nesterenkonia sp. HG001 TaxID=2983207 RepID=UPI003A0FFD2E
MRLKIIPHCQRRMQMRGISRAAIEQVLWEHKRLGSQPSRDHPNRRVYIVDIHPKPLYVVTQPPIEDAAPESEIVVITAYFKDDQ